MPTDDNFAGTVTPYSTLAAADWWHAHYALNAAPSVHLGYHETFCSQSHLVPSPRSNLSYIPPHQLNIHIFLPHKPSIYNLPLSFRVLELNLQIMSVISSSNSTKRYKTDLVPEKHRWDQLINLQQANILPNTSPGPSPKREGRP